MPDRSPPNDVDKDVEKQQDMVAHVSTEQPHDKVQGNTTFGLNDDSPSSEIVDWDGASDPSKPMNWANTRKAKNIIVICYCTFLTPLGSTMFAPAIPQVMATYHSSDPLLSSFVVSVWVLGYFFGPLFLGPLSELYGRLPVYLVCNVLFTVFNVATAVSPSLSALIVFRFLAGTFGGCPITIGAGTFGDTIKPASRGKIIAIWSLGPIMGPILGPIIGGYMGESVGWRWICWTLAIASGAGAIASFIFQEETYPPILLERKVRRLRKETGNANLHRAGNKEARKPSQVFARAIIRPLKLLFLSPSVAALSLYQGMVYGYLYLLFTTFPTVFSGQYHFNTGTIGLTYLGLGIGSLIGLAAAGAMSDRLLKKLASKGDYKPEYRLPPLIPSAFCIPVGLFWYGWSAQAKTHWIVPLLGTVFVGIGANVLMVSRFIQVF